MILADENIPFEITKSLRTEGFEVMSVYESARGIKDEEVIELALKYDFLLTQTLQRPFFATITTRKIRIRQL